MSSIITSARSLLRDDAGPGYPAGYLMARLHGRRARLAASRGGTAAGAISDEEIWNAFLGEMDWLFNQMQASMRADYAPLFLLFEMKTIVLCLRNASLQRMEPRRQLLERSLLSARVRDILGAPRHVGAIVADLGDALGSLSRSFDGLDGRYFESGLRGCEDALMRLFLESLRGAKLAPALRQFITRFTDFRNLMAIYKHLRWELKGPVVLIAGGSLNVAALKQMVIKEDRDALDALVTSVTGQPITAANELALETTLLTALGAELARARRARGDAWVVTDYAWSAYVHARNLAVRRHAASLDRATIAREVIA